MSLLRFIPGGVRRRWGVIGVAAGVAIGSGIGAGALSRSSRATVSSIDILHPAPTMVRPGRAATLSAAVLCAPADAPDCQVAQALAHVRPRGGVAWTDIVGTNEGGGFQFTVPAESVLDDGFEYWLEFQTQAGGLFSYPSTGPENPLVVLTTAGLTKTSVPDGFSWGAVRRPDQRVLFLPYGSGPGEVGRWGGRPDQDLLGPSSFAVAPDGGIDVVDWVNDRIEEFVAGRLVRTIPTPVHQTLDAAVAHGGVLDLLTLGTGGTVYEVSAADGRVLGRYPVGSGVPSRVASTARGPFVSVGPAQWVPVRSASGLPLSSWLQDLRMAPGPTLPGGVTYLSDAVGDKEIGAVWTNPDGSTAGSLIRLPAGVRAGGEYFGQPLPEGGVELARGLWDDQHFVVGLFRLSAEGDLLEFSLLPEPSTQMDARSSTVRWRAPGEVLVAYAKPHGVAIDAFAVTP